MMNRGVLPIILMAVGALILFAFIWIPIVFFAKGLLVLLLQVIAVILVLAIAYAGIYKPLSAGKEINPIQLGVVIAFLLILSLFSTQIGSLLGAIVPGAAAIQPGAAVQIQNAPLSEISTNIWAFLAVPWNLIWLAALIFAFGILITAMIAPEEIQRFTKWLGVE